MKNTKSEESSQPNILLFDLETTTHQGLFWGKTYETDIVEVLEYGKILSYAAKWLGKKTFVRGWVDTKDEKKLVKELRELFDKADILVGHNAKSFDVKWCNTKFIQYGIPLPSPYKIVDTKLEARKYLALPSYKLATLGDYFNLGGKVEHEGFSLWLKCVSGDKKAWSRMKKYNKQDVDLLEKVYLKLLPLMDKHPRGQFIGKEMCEKCGSNHLTAQGRKTLRDKVVQQLKCRDCGGWQYLKVNEKKQR